MKIAIATGFTGLVMAANMAFAGEVDLMTAENAAKEVCSLRHSDQTQDKITAMKTQLAKREGDFKALLAKAFYPQARAVLTQTIASLKDFSPAIEAAQQIMHAYADEWTKIESAKYAPALSAQAEQIMEETYQKSFRSIVGQQLKNAGYELVDYCGGYCTQYVINKDGEDTGWKINSNLIGGGAFLYSDQRKITPRDKMSLEARFGLLTDSLDFTSHPSSDNGYKIEYYAESLPGLNNINNFKNIDPATFVDALSGQTLEKIALASFTNSDIAMTRSSLEREEHLQEQISQECGAAGLAPTLK